MSIDTVAYIGEAIGQEGRFLCRVPQAAELPVAFHVSRDTASGFEFLSQEAGRPTIAVLGPVLFSPVPIPCPPGSAEVHPDLPATLLIQAIAFACRHASCLPARAGGGSCCSRCLPSGHAQREACASGMDALTELIAAGGRLSVSGMRRPLHGDPGHFGTLPAT